MFDVLAFAVDLQEGAYEEHGGTGGADEAGEEGTREHEHAVHGGPCGEIAGDADTAADGKEAEEQDNEGDIVAHDGMAQDGRNGGKAAFGAGKAVAAQSIVEAGDACQSAGNDELVVVLIPPFGNVGHLGQQGNGQ